MNFIHSIKLRFTLWYLSVFTLLIILLGSSVYLTLSHNLRRNMDDKLKNRAAQLAGLRDIISIVAGGTFEEEIGELVSFYFYGEGTLRHVSHKEQAPPLDRTLIERAIQGHASFSTMEISPGRRLRAYITPFTPDNSRTGEENLRPRPEDGRTGSADRPPRPEDGRTGSADRPPRPEDRRSGSADRPPRPEDRRTGSADRPPRPVIYRPTGEISAAALVVARPTGEMDLALERLLQIFLIAGPLVILLSAGGGIFLARRAFKPVEEIAETARAIEGSDLGKRIEVHTKDELGSLAATLNQMIGRLEKAFKRQKQFTGDASHELRAPLAIIQAESTLALQRERDPSEYQKSLGVISLEADHMSGIINQLLTLARADAGKEQSAFERLDLPELIRDLCCDVEILCREKGIGLRLDLPGTVVVNGDKRSLRRLVHNLVGNAIRHTSRGGTISVTLQRENKGVVLSVIDTGTGIPPEEIPLIFERFYRVDKARSREDGGSGLGLAICRHIVGIHGGTIDVQSRVGEGSTFRVRLPLIME